MKESIKKYLSKTANYRGLLRKTWLKFGLVASIVGVLYFLQYISYIPILVIIAAIVTALFIPFSILGIIYERTQKGKRKYVTLFGLIGFAFGISVIAFKQLESLSKLTFIYHNFLSLLWGIFNLELSENKITLLPLSGELFMILFAFMEHLIIKHGKETNIRVEPKKENFWKTGAKKGFKIGLIVAIFTLIVFLWTKVYCENRGGLGCGLVAVPFIIIPYLTLYPLMIFKPLINTLPKEMINLKVFEIMLIAAFPVIYSIYGALIGWLIGLLKIRR